MIMKELDTVYTVITIMAMIKILTISVPYVMEILMSKLRVVYVLLGYAPSRYLRTVDEEIKFISVHNPDSLRGMQADKIYFPASYRFKETDDHKGIESEIFKEVKIAVMPSNGDLIIYE